jgi:hypothetical protein
MNTNLIVEEIKQTFDQLVSGVIHFAPRIILAVIALLVGLLVAKLIKTLIKSVLLFIDKRINERLGSPHLKLDFRGASIFIASTIYWMIIILTIAIVSRVLELPVLTAWFGDLIAYVPNVLAAIVLIFAGMIAGRFVQDLMLSVRIGAVKYDPKLLGRFARYIIIFISITIALDQLGINIQFFTNLIIVLITTLLFGAALAFALGAKTAVSNILGSYYTRKMYKEGDSIQISDIAGIIVKITATNIVVKTNKGDVSIPAKDFNSEKTVLIQNI